MEPDYIHINKALWDARVTHHIGSEFYDQEGFNKGATSLKSIELDLLGDVTGKEVLHLQCHFGQDTLSLARMGADVTGLDFSEEAVRQARKLAENLNLEAKFIWSDVYKAAEVIDRPADIVFTSYGVLGWLPDIHRWARVVADCLEPGGVLVLVEFHPVIWMYNTDFTEIVYSYFNRQPIIETEEGTYTDKNAPIAMKSVNWNHPLDDVLGSLLDAGFEISSFREFDYSPYPIFPERIEVASGKFQIKGLEGKLPIVYAVRAVKK